MYCTRCGFKLDAFVAFCPECAADLGLGGALRFTDPNSELSIQIKTQDLSKELSQPMNLDQQKEQKTTKSELGSRQLSRVELEKLVEDLPLESPAPTRGFRLTPKQKKRRKRLAVVLITLIIGTLVGVVILASYLMGGVKIDPPAPTSTSPVATPTSSPTPTP